MPLLTIASLTLREALRRRIALVAGILSIGIVVISAWGLGRLSTSLAGLALVSVLTILLAFLMSVVLGIGAAFLAAPAIASDVESGIVLAVLPRPLSRAEFVLGKWLGLVTLLVGYAALFGTLEVVAITLTTGYRPPHPALALAYLIGQGIVVLSLALLLSTRCAPVTGGLIAVLCFGAAWIAGIAAGVAATVNNAQLMHAMTVIGLILPTDGLWRGAVYALEPIALLVTANVTGTNPFGVTTPPGPAFIAWAGGWVVVVLGAAIASFERRDL